MNKVGNHSVHVFVTDVAKEKDMIHTSDTRNDVMYIFPDPRSHKIMNFSYRKADSN